MNKDKLTRRDLLKTATLAGAGLGLTRLGLAAEASPPGPDAAGEGKPSAPGPLGETAAPGAVTSNANTTDAKTIKTMMGVKFDSVESVRIAIIGVGARGGSMLPEFLALDHVQVTAVCDVVKDRLLWAQKVVEKTGQKPPAAYSAGDHDFENLCRRDDIDFVYIATPWEWHVPMALAALSSGKHAGVEVPAATTLKDCWALVDASERYRRHCLIMENCCYGYNELMVLNMIREGLLGEPLHAEGAYDHDLRELLFSDQSEGLWRRFPHISHDGNLYPTHSLGPIARYMNINRGDHFDYIVSMSSPERGLSLYREHHVPKNSPKWKERYRCGDVNTSLIRTALGRTIMLQHAVTTPRPYDRINLVSCTKGIFRDYPARLYLDGQPGNEDWMVPAQYDKYKSEYEHTLWAQVGELARKRGGHGGMDLVMVYRLVQCMRQGLAPDIDVYDAAAWSAPGPLSEASVAQGSAPAKFPDFTRGKSRLEG